MKKITKQSLKLSVQTIRLLQDPDLTTVTGGVILYKATTCPCPTTVPPR